MGRPRGSLNKRTLARQQMAAQAISRGAQPLEIILDNMLFFSGQAHELLMKIMNGLDKPSDKTMELFKKMVDARLQAEACAVDAAPYCHARLAAVTMKDVADQPLPDRMSTAEALEEFRRRGLPLPTIIEDEPSSSDDQVQ